MARNPPQRTVQAIGSIQALEHLRLDRFLHRRLNVVGVRQYAPNTHIGGGVVRRDLSLSATYVDLVGRLVGTLLTDVGPLTNTAPQQSA